MKYVIKEHVQIFTSLGLNEFGKTKVFIVAPSPYWLERQET